ncbi:LuxR C-terminal-related transcriptional regulator [Streptomyces sp. G5(2025)]|uniref:LuxR C-terminal-related transcriptional regulator n=1 Tax=Streptomyces sp. G5(2025) TaxID=3406628 RepID=UPI003C155DCE
MDSTWDSDSVSVLDAAGDILRAPLDEVLPRLSGVLAGLIPHRAAAELATECAHSPFKTAGEAALAERITAAELDRLGPVVGVGRTWQGTAGIGGAEHPVLALHSDRTTRGALLVLVREQAGPLDTAAIDTARVLWDLVTSHLDRLAAEALPGALAQSRAAAGARARAIAEAGEAHTAVLTGLLGVLRSRGLDDGAARAAATELAVSALLDLRAEAERDQSVAEEPADQAFTRLEESLRPLLRHSEVRLALAPPGTARRLPADVAHAGRAIGRGLLLAVLEQDGVDRVHVGWRLDDTTLHVTVRDDGPGALSYCSLGRRRVTERVEALGGRLDVDAVEGWGTTVTVSLPLGTKESAGTADPLAALGARELEVLGELARGRRNRDIAERLHISESTVKFHVANILSKLGVGSRGEAAARFHAAA